ncbi:PAS domain S-box protein [Methanosarcina hadiensis]|uniref:PAS domain-containing protein n=1 Tax=Methanosarcina hadiensis TaxID=3078083 RepID=UPI003977D16E
MKKDGNEVWISISPYIIINPENRPDFVIQINDITKHKKADVSFKFTELSFDSIYKNVCDGVAINEQVGKFLEANPSMCKKLGYRREELLQKTATEFVSYVSSKIFAEQVKKLYLRGYATVQVTAVCRDNILLPVELNMWLIDYKGKNAIFSIIKDIKE